MPIRAYFWPRAKYHFRELKSILEPGPKSDRKRRRIDGILARAHLQLVDASAKKYSYTDTDDKRLTSSDEEVMDFDVISMPQKDQPEQAGGSSAVYPSSVRLQCRFFSPGLLEIKADKDQLDAYARRIFESIYSVWPYVKTAMVTLPLEEASKDWTEEEMEDDSVIMMRCCEQFVKVVVDAFRQDEVVERLEGPINSEGYLWNFLFERTGLSSKAITNVPGANVQDEDRELAHAKLARNSESIHGKTVSQGIRDSVDFKLLYVFDAGEYLKQTWESLKYFDKHIRNGGENLQKELKNIKFMIEWTTMRNQRAQNIFDHESRGSEHRLGNLVLLLTYETIVLTLVQVARSFFETDVLLGSPLFISLVVIGILLGPLLILGYETLDARKTRHRRVAHDAASLG